jgi:diadenylate cyclase
MPPFALPVPKLTLTRGVDILAVAILIYNVFLMVRGRRAAHALTGVVLVALLYAVAVWANLEVFRTVVETLAPYTAIALIVMFQPELRRLLTRFGRVLHRGGFLGQLERREVLEEIVLAVRQIVESKKTGALIVIERDQGLRTFIESGVPLDAQVSRDLLCAIFQPGGTLHDGAVIVQGDRIAAAACFLPLTTKPVRNLGTRHRAAIGITEDSDALAVVVSEETWRISIAAHGELETSVKLENLLERLTSHTSPRAAKTGPTPEPEHAES